jgi:hypothetical protein
MINFNSFKSNIYFMLLYQDTNYNMIEQLGNLISNMLMMPRDQNQALEGARSCRN